MRAKLLEPLRTQRSEIITSLDGAYGRVIKANTAVTGYLASLVKVTDLQNDLLRQMGVPDLSEKVGKAALEISSKLDEETKQAKTAADKAEALKKKLDDFIKRWHD
jgi:selenophosphate synthetase-related protein